MSAILSVDDLNDFISPGVACIKPVETLPKNDSEQNAYEVTTEDKIQQNPTPAQISLTDCLACSGCVTSAEAVLISLQSHAEVLNSLDSYRGLLLPSREGYSQVNDETRGDGKIFVASVSPQARASLAAAYGIPEKEASYMIDQFLCGPQGLRSGGERGNGFTWVVDTNVAREAVLALSVDEVAKSLHSNNTHTSFPTPTRPVLSSACPGWICYVEKTHPHILPHLSRLKSPQALMGTLLKTTLSKALGISTSQIWHLAIMPCFDKKLEASREELTDTSWQIPGTMSSRSRSPVRDVDCVITIRELLTLASSRGISLPTLPLKPVPLSFKPQFPDKTLGPFLSSFTPLNQAPASGTSGGYLHHVLTAFQSQNPNSQIVRQQGRNADVVEYTLVSSSGEPILKAARYYGFRNIQNLVRKLKPARVPRLPGSKSTSSPSMVSQRAPNSRPIGGGAGSRVDYAYVEVMACPGGCTNGGGQIRTEDIKSDVSAGQAASLSDVSGQSLHEKRMWLSRVDEAYFSAESESEMESRIPFSLRSILNHDDKVREILGFWSSVTGIPLPKLAYTTHRRVESDVGRNKGVGDTAQVIELVGKIGGGW